MSLASKGTWGGRRQGAGRPPGSRNKPRLIQGLPETPDPLQWLLALMNHEGATLRQRMAAAKVLLPYCHQPTDRGVDSNLPTFAP